MIDYQLGIIDRYLGNKKKSFFDYDMEEVKEKKKEKEAVNTDIPASEIVSNMFNWDLKDSDTDINKKKKKKKKKSKSDPRIVDHEGYDSSEYSIKEMDDDRHNFQEYLRVIDRYAILKSITPEEYKKAKKVIEKMIDDLKHYRYWKVYDDSRHSEYLKNYSGYSDN